MNDIERRAARILELGRAEPAPSLAVTERVRAALRARHLADPTLFTASATGASAAGSASLKLAIFKALGLGAALGVGVSVGVYQLQPPTETPALALVRSATSAEPTKPFPTEVVSAAPRSPEPGPPPSPSARGAAPQLPKSLPSATTDVVTLEREIALLREAQGALHRGAPARTLSVLATLDRERPRGTLMEEREATRAIARCRLGLGRTEALGSFERDFALSVHAARVRAACAANGATSGDGNGSGAH